MRYTRVEVLLISFFRRTRFITHFRQQAKLASVFVLWAVVLMLCLIGLFFVNYATISTETGSLVTHDQLVTKMFLVEQAFQLAWTFGSVMLIFVILMGLHVMAYAHRMTGPIFKMNRVLKNAAHNQDWPKPFKFRKGDAFHELADSFNHFVEVMKEKEGRK
jgi:methyl-accepting chemotaxis protein